MTWKNIANLLRRNRTPELDRSLEAARQESKARMLELIEELEAEEACDCPVEHIGSSPEVSHWPDALPSLRIMKIEKEE